MRTIKIALASIVVILTVFFVWPTHQASTVLFSVMTFNIENGGTQIDFNKVVEAIKKSNADVVGIQEAWGNTSRLAKELGWKYFSNQQHIISRHPLLESTDSKGIYTLVELKPGYVVAMANMHLPDENYGPDMMKAGAHANKVEATETKTRLPTALPFIEKLAALAQRGIPVFLTGDFNSPSHLDWQHRPAPVIWPVTKMIEDKGFIDAYHEVNPTIEAITWPAGRPIATHSFDGFNPGKNDLTDRLDFIFSANAKVISAAIVGEPAYKAATIAVSPWPSDHRAVVARFKVTPASIASFGEKPTPIKSTPASKPSISVTNASVKSGEDITISWRNTPGNRFDYIMIVPVGSQKTAWGEAVRLYTHGELNGSVVYNKSSAKGNWLDWNVGEEGHWPLKPGKYDIRLMLDDGFTQLDKVQIEVKGR